MYDYRRAERVAAILAAIETEQLSRQEAEALLGFLQIADSDGPPPSRATWFRRCAQLRELGVIPPRLPAALRV